MENVKPEEREWTKSPHGMQATNINSISMDYKYGCVDVLPRDS